MAPLAPTDFGQGEHTVCSAINAGDDACRLCRETHRKLRASARSNGRLARATCHIGLTSFSVAFSLGVDRWCYAEGGRLFERLPNLQSRRRLSAHLHSLGLADRNVAKVCATLDHSVRKGPAEVSASLSLLECVCQQIQRELDETPELWCSDPLVDRAKEFVRAHLTEKLGVQRVARHVRVSDDHFSRMFKARTGERFTSYVLRKRIERACRLLQQTSLPVTEIAMESGFQSVPHFNRVFRGLTSRTPREHRRSIKVEDAS